MIDLFKPDIYQESIFQIDFNKVKAKGIKCIAFDLDNTITKPHSYRMREDTVELINNLKKDFIVVLLSNSLKHRVKKLSEINDLPHYSFSLKPTQRNYKKLKKDYDLKDNEILTIGDQLLTDVLGSKRAKVNVALVKRITDQEFFISRFNRLIERIIFKKLNKAYNIKEGEYYQ